MKLLRDNLRNALNAFARGNELDYFKLSHKSGSGGKVD